MSYFTEKTVSNIRHQRNLSLRHQLRSLDITLACKLTLTYGKYHLMKLHRQLAMSEEQTSFQQAEITADMMNKITVFHSSPTDFLHTQEQSADESIDVYKEYKQLVAEFSDEHFEPSIADQFCKTVYEDEEHFIFFKPFCNLYFSVYADALLWYQQGKIEYDEFCMHFQELSWMDGHRTPLDGKRLKMYIMSMREVVDWYKELKKQSVSA